MHWHMVFLAEKLQSVITNRWMEMEERMEWQLRLWQDRSGDGAEISTPATWTSQDYSTHSYRPYSIDREICMEILRLDQISPCCILIRMLISADPAATSPASPNGTNRAFLATSSPLLHLRTCRSPHPTPDTHFYATKRRHQ